MSASSPEKKAGFRGLLSSARSFVMDDLWDVETRDAGARGAALSMVQLAVMIAQGFVRDRLLLRASALTYVTTLALIPMLAVMVGIMQIGSGGDQLMRMVVDGMTAVSPSVREIIIDQVQKADFRSLGTIGAALLIVTSVLALRHLEMTLNEIWGVEDHRTWTRRFSDYLTVLIVAPMLTGVALSMGATVQGAHLLSEVVDAQAAAQLQAQWISLLPWLSLVVAFSFLYWFFPNTSVKPAAALAGGVVAAILFSVTRYFYVDLNVGVTKYNAVFGGFAALPLVLAWIYACWAVVLFGAEVAFASQNLAHYRREVRGAEPTMAERESIGLRVALEIGRAFREGLGSTSADALSLQLDLPVRIVREQIRALHAAGLLEQTTDESDNERVLPARPLTAISVSDVFHAIRGDRSLHGGEAPGADPTAVADSEEAATGAYEGAENDVAAGDPGARDRAAVVRDITRKVDDAFESVAGPVSLDDLLAS